MALQTYAQIKANRGSAPQITERQQGIAAFLQRNAELLKDMDKYAAIMFAYDAGVNAGLSSRTRGAKYDGEACNKCGSTVRYVSNRMCVNCLGKRAPKSNL